MSRICIVGQGYVGLVTAAGLARIGHHVIGLDVDGEKIARLLAGEVPIYEPGLDELIVGCRADGRLRFTTNYAEAVPEAEFVFLAVPTPEGPTGEADLRYLHTAAQSLAEHLQDGTIVAIKSTVPPGTADRVSEWINRQRAGGSPIRVVSHPEFLREGSAIEDFFHPDRIVVGATDEAAAAAVAGLYTRLDCPALITDRPTAEMIKYASNAFLATKISFINEIAQICEKVRADVKYVALGMGYDRRIGHQFLAAGLGYGGSCFPKDVKALEFLATTHGGHPQLLRSVMEINRAQRLGVMNILRERLGDLQGRTIGLLGLAFKPNTDDLRGAPAIDLAHCLMREGCRVVAYDPVAAENATRAIPEVTCCPDVYAVAASSDAVVLVTEWDEFRQIDLGRVRDLMRTPIFVDGRNMFEPAQMRELGFVYQGIGRGTNPSHSIARTLQVKRAPHVPAASSANGASRTSSAAGSNGHGHVADDATVLWPSAAA